MPRKKSTNPRTPAKARTLEQLVLMSISVRIADSLRAMAKAELTLDQLNSLERISRNLAAVLVVKPPVQSRKAKAPAAEGAAA